MYPSLLNIAGSVKKTVSICICLEVFAGIPTHLPYIHKQFAHVDKERANRTFNYMFI